MMMVYLLIVTSSVQKQLVTVHVFETPQLARASGNDWLKTYNDVKIEVRPQMVREHRILSEELER